MKKIIYYAVPIALIASLFINTIGKPLPIGASLPNATQKMKRSKGNEVSFKDVMVKNGLLVMFSCNTCPIVKK